MDKIKSLLTGNTASSTTDNTTSASTVSDAAHNTQHTPHSGLSGEGSHFGARDGANTTSTSSGLPGTGTSTSTSNPLTHQTNVTGSTTGPNYTPGKGLSGEGSHLGQATGGSHMPGSWDEGNSAAGQTTPGQGLTGGSTTGHGLTGGNTTDRGYTDSNTAGQGLTGSNTAGRGLTGSSGQGLTGSNTTNQGITGSNTTSGAGSHLGRDATGLGPSRVAGEGLHHHDQSQLTGSHLPGQSGDRSFPLSTTGSNTQTSGLTGSNPSTGERLGQDSYNPGSTSGSHLGRDAGLVGGAAAVGQGLHHQNKDHTSTTGSGLTGSSTGIESNTTSAHPGLGSSTGPHSTDTANLLDPRVNTGGPKEDAITHDPKHGGGAEQADKHHVGGGGGVLGAAELAKLAHNKRETGTGSGIGSTSTEPYNDSTRSSHFGRDAAIAGGVGGAALGAEHHKHDKDLTQAERDTKRDHKHELKEEKKHHHDEKTHHLGRDTAAAGGVGGAALGAEHHKHDRDLTQAERDAKRDHKHELKEEKKSHHDEKSHHLGRDTVAAGGVGGATYEAEKHHNKNIDPATGKEHHLGGDSSSGGTTMWDKLHNKPADTTQHQGSVHSGTLAGTGEGYSNTIPSPQHPSGEHHLGRDAAVGGGALGAGGLAAHEHNKHNASHQGSMTGTGKSEYDPNFARAELARLQAEKGDHREGVIPVTHEGSLARNVAHSDGTTHEYARDGTVGAGGLGNNHQTSTTGVPSTTGQAGYSSTGPQTTTDTTQDHHYGHDAAVGTGVAGAAGAAYGADKHHDSKAEKKDEKLEKKEEQAVIKEEKKEHKAAVKEEKKEEKAEKKEEKKHHGLFSFLHRDKSKKYTKEEEDEFDRQEKEHNSHAGRNTALGTGAVGAGTAYETQHHSANTADDAASTTAIHHGQVGDSKVGTSTGQHGATPLVAKEPGTDLGDKLHGTERNRGVPGSSGFPGTEGFDSGTTHTHNTGRDVALGGLGGAGVGMGAGGINEQKGLESQGLGQHDPSHSFQQHNTSGGLPSHTTGQSGSGLTGLEQDGRNRLHKDPPAGHPASQQYQSGNDSHVPASGSQRESLLNEGKSDLDHRSGVAGSHTTTGNTGSNTY